MKNLLLLCFMLISFTQAPCQSFYNGDFENTTSTSCDYNMPDSDVNMKMPHVYGFGKTYLGGQYIGEIDIQTADCYVFPQSGNWCMGIASDYTIYTTSDAVALELTAHLIPGTKYKLSFYLYSNPNFANEAAYVKVGESLTNTDFGNIIDTVTSIQGFWKNAVIEFTATLEANYITVKNQVGLNAWNQIDHFTISRATDTNEASGTLNFEVFPNPASDYAVIRVPDINSYHVSLINAIGSTVFQKEINAGESQIDLSGVARGIYFIQLKDDYGRISSKRIVLN